MPKPPNMPSLPLPSPAMRLFPGLSREKVARNLGMSVDEVARVERMALAKARAEMLRRGLDIHDLLSLIPITEYKHHDPHQDQA